MLRTYQISFVDRILSSATLYLFASSWSIRLRWSQSGSNMSSQIIFRIESTRRSGFETSRNLRWLCHSLEMKPRGSRDNPIACCDFMTTCCLPSYLVQSNVSFPWNTCNNMSMRRFTTDFGSLFSFLFFLNAAITSLRRSFMSGCGHWKKCSIVSSWWLHPGHCLIPVMCHRLCITGSQPCMSLHDWRNLFVVAFFRTLPTESQSTWSN